MSDLHSRKIVGWHAAESLNAVETLKALEMAIEELPANRWPLHHSDRGSQYCCHEYVKVLAERSLPISMTEANHCYENCYAERINGTLKLEYNLDLRFRSRSQAFASIEESIWLYNNERPHDSLEKAHSGRNAQASGLKPLNLDGRFAPSLGLRPPFGTLGSEATIQRTDKTTQSPKPITKLKVST